MAAKDMQAGASVPQPLDAAWCSRLVRQALDEDAASLDVTTLACVPIEARARGRVVAREAIVVCGLDLAEDVFRQLDGSLLWRGQTRDGESVAPGATLASVEGRARGILTGERTALNFLQRMSGIATLAHRAVEIVRGTGAVVLDTRKTTPTLRALEKYAVRTGGAANHRTDLREAVLIKDNHVALAGGVREAVRLAGTAGHEASAIEVEVEDIEGAVEALGLGVGRILLDNFTPGAAADAVRRIAGRAKVEISGGLTLENLRAYAEAGADFLSLGSLTHSARAADLSLEVEALS